MNRSVVGVLYSAGTVDECRGAHVRGREGAARGVEPPASDRAGVWGGVPRK